MNTIQIAVILQTVTLVSDVASLEMDEWEDKKLPMAWIDGLYRVGEEEEFDTFFDRIIPIYIYDPTITEKPCVRQTTGVFIKEQLVLTSFNAFRDIAAEENTLQKLRVNYFIDRFHTGARTQKYRFTADGFTVDCGRQVIPSLPKKTWPIHMRHGNHSPVHDLMVLRLTTPVKFIEPVPPPLQTFSLHDGWEKTKEKLHILYVKKNFAPIKTILAKPGEKLYRNEMKFASLGHLSDEHIEARGYLEKGDFGDIVDCDEWILREWGYFICVENSLNYPGLAAGAMLYNSDKLFGVGAFLLVKGSRSILVFTDVRPYWHLLHRTCTEDDQNFGKPKS